MKKWLSGFVVLMSLFIGAGTVLADSFDIEIKSMSLESYIQLDPSSFYGVRVQVDSLNPSNGQLTTDSSGVVVESVLDIFLHITVTNVLSGGSETETIKIMTSNAISGSVKLLGEVDVLDLHYTGPPIQFGDDPIAGFVPLFTFDSFDISLTTEGVIQSCSSINEICDIVFGMQSFSLGGMGDTPTLTDWAGPLFATLTPTSTSSPPRCNIDVVLGADGKITAKVIEYWNFGPDSVPVELKVWLEIPGSPPLSFLNLGSDGTLIFPAGLEEIYGPVELFTWADKPIGKYLLGCRLLDPVTGELISEDLNVLIKMSGGSLPLP